MKKQLNYSLRKQIHIDSHIRIIQTQMLTRWLRSKDASALVKVRGISVDVDCEKLHPMGHLNNLLKFPQVIILSLDSPSNSPDKILSISVSSSQGWNATEP